MTTRSVLISLVCLFSALIFVELPGTKLFEPDEARYAEIPREMLATGDFITPRQNGSVYLEKPPLLYWLNAASIKLFGENPFAARLPARLASLGVVLILLYALRNSPLPNLGLWSALFFLANPLTLGLSRINITDGLLTFALTLTLFNLRSFIFNDREPSWWTQAGLGIGLAMALLTKGLIGLVFPIGLVVIWTVLFRRWNLIKNIIFSPALPLFFLLAAPWFFWVQKANPDFFRYFFIHEHFERFATTEAKRTGPVYYFLLTFLWGFLPWTLHFGVSLKEFFKGVRRRLPTEEVFFGLWIFMIAGFFSISQSKLIPYIFPVWPAAAVLVALALGKSPGGGQRLFFINALLLSCLVPAAFFLGLKDGVLHRYSLIGEAFAISLAIVGGGWMAGFLAKKDEVRALLTLASSWLIVFIVLIVNAPAFADDYSSERLARSAQQSGAETIVSYSCYPESLPWILKAPLPVVNFRGELCSLGPLNPALFWDEATFRSHWESPEKMAVVLRHHQLGSFTASLKSPAAVLDQNRRYILLANFPVN